MTKRHYIVDTMEDTLSVVTLLVLFPAFSIYSVSYFFYLFLLIQLVFNIYFVHCFKCRYAKFMEDGISVHKREILVINLLLLKQQLAACKCRFCVAVFFILSYLDVTKNNCIGYEPSINCKTSRGDRCGKLVYSLCVCFFYTVFVSQQLHLTKSELCRGAQTAGFRILGVITVSSAFAYSICRDFDTLNI